jgi:nucleobase transporter 1/2
MGLSLPDYIAKQTAALGHSPISTGNTTLDSLITSIMTTPAAVALILTLFFDNTIPGTAEERGMGAWQQIGRAGAGADWWEDDHMNEVSQDIYQYRHPVVKFLSCFLSCLGSAKHEIACLCY